MREQRIVLILFFTTQLFISGCAQHIQPPDQVCIKTAIACFSISQLSTSRLYHHTEQYQEFKYIEFKHILNTPLIKQLSHQYQLSKPQQRKFIQQSAHALNQQSITRFKNNNPSIDDQQIIAIPLNNTALILTKKSAQKFNHSHHEQLITFNNSRPVVALLDSGVSNQHQEFAGVLITQYNPKTNDNRLVDTGLGHGTGMLSLIAANGQANQMKGLLPRHNYLSCNGLPNGKYHFIYILQCTNWLFIQPRVDVAINAWLASTPGCKTEWINPLQVLWLSQTIPVFAAGNYGQTDSMNYSPVNLPLYFPDLRLISVANLNRNAELSPDSSYAYKKCTIKTPSHVNKTLQKALPKVNLAAVGEKIKVAFPVSASSYNKVSGTSYSVVFVAATIAKLKNDFPFVSNANLIKTIIDNANKQPISGTNTLIGTINAKQTRTALKLLP